MTLPRAFLDDVKATLPKRAWTDDAARIAPRLTEWRGKYKGTADLMLLPGSLEEVALCVRLCARYRLPIATQGGNTGLVGAGVPCPGEVLLAFDRLRRIRSVDAADASLIAEAGVPLAEAQNAAAEAGLMLPLSIASEGTASLGGIAATNAGGVHVLRYGMARNLILGVEAVLADGTIWHGLSTLRKDNTGYDLRHLLVGSEGTLGLITAVSMGLVPPTPHRALALVAVDDPAGALGLLALARKGLGDALNAFELMPRFGLDLVARHMGRSDPMAGAHDWFVLVEAAGGAADTALPARFEAWLAEAMTQGPVRDGVLAQSEGQAAELWALRDSLSEAQKVEGGSIKHDVALPVGRVPAFLDRATAAVQSMVPGCRPCPFGHLGDGNIHFNISQPPDMDRAAFLDHWAAMNARVHDIVADMGGSISAEHGIGVLKVAEHARLCDPAKLSAQRAIKQALDPHNLLNPGRVVVPTGHEER